MRLTLQSVVVGDVLVIRCQGRIVAGKETDALQAELEKQTKIPGTNTTAYKKVVLQLGEMEFIDSFGLGCLVRMLSVLRASGGDLKLCQLTPFVLRVLQITQLLNVLMTYPSENEAIAAFSGTVPSPHAGTASSGRSIICVDASADLLAYLSAVLKRRGYGVSTTKYPGEAMTLVTATKPAMVICGPGMMRMSTGQSTIDKIRISSPQVKVLVLPADFSTEEAGQAGVELAERVQSLLKS
jgi:anti-sigma B factor antagonist